MKQIQYTISGQDITISEIERLISDGSPLHLDQNLSQKINDCNSFLNELLEKDDTAYYGINTGFGSLCNVKIPKEHIQKLQWNLVCSHACGMGEVVPIEIVRIILFLKIRNLSLAYSGVRIVLIDKMIGMYNNEIWPVLFQQGSLGASGDLAPLAHLSLPLIGEGMVNFKDSVMASREAFDQCNLTSISLEAKEGLALLNGTQFSTSYAVYAIQESHKIMAWAHAIACLSMDVFGASIKPMDPKIHEIRRQSGQIQSAATIRKWLEDSELSQSPAQSVQDPYSFRCTPQVLGATLDVVDHVSEIVTNEINAVTDNPNIFYEEEEILSGGNFHAQPIALALDYLAIGIAEVANLSERRTYQLISGQRGLPAFLIPEPGLSSGFMIPQYTAASIVSQNKQLCTPASVDSIVSSNGQEDHVSMAANAGTKMYRVIQNTWSVLAIEWLTACQGIEFRRNKKTGSALEKLIQEFRKEVPFHEKDVLLHNSMIKSIEFIRSQKL